MTNKMRKIVKSNWNMNWIVVDPLTMKDRQPMTLTQIENVFIVTNKSAIGWYGFWLS